MERLSSRIMILAMTLAVPLVCAAERPTTFEREQIDDRYKWNLSTVYPNWEAWESALAAATDDVSSFADHRGTLDQSPDQLVVVLTARSSLLADVETIESFAYLNWVEDTRRADAQQRMDQAKQLRAAANGAVSWLIPELLEIPQDKVASWVETYPALDPFKPLISETFRKRARTLDAEGERLLSLYQPVNSSMATLYNSVTVADARFPEVTLERGETIRATSASSWQSLNRDRLQEDRRAVFEGFMGVFGDREHTLATLYSAVLKRNFAMATARGYDSCLEAALDEFMIPVAVYDTLINTAYQGADPLRRYHRLRRRFLKLDSYHEYDRRVPLVETTYSFAYDDMREPLVDSVAPLGAEYQREVETFFEQRRIDVYENEGKQPRNFALTVYGFPAFLKLNYGDTIEDAFMFAHEMGHGMHGNLTRNNQPFDSYEYSTFVAETASIFSEFLFNDQLLKESDDPRLRIGLLQYRIDSIAMAFYEIAVLADFERRAHQLVESGSPVNVEILQDLYLESYERLYGDAMSDPDEVRNAWMTWVHLFFDRPFYVFQYATSLAASTALHAQVTHGSEEERMAAVERYLTMLRAGASDHPVELLRRAGVDLIDPTSLGALVTEMDRLVTRLEGELESIE